MTPVGQEWMPDSEPEYDDEVADPDAEPLATPRDETGLVFYTIAELRVQVKQAGPRRWLVRGIWPAGTYGVHAAEQKAQKSWNALDLAVSVASGTPWLGHFAVDDPGPALVFAGEGGRAAILRRVDAIAEHKGLDPDGLRLAICERVAHLGNNIHMLQVARHLDRYHPKLVILDPLYLAARGAELGDIYKMGALLEQVQHMCAAADAGLFLVHHYNRARDQRGGSKRMTGAGPAEWGRVLIGATVITSHTDATTQETRVLTELDVIGGEIPDSRFRILRTIRAEDPDHLDSPLHYTATVTAGADTPPPITQLPDAKPAVQRVHAILTAAEQPLTVTAIGDQLADHGHPLKARTIQDALHQLGNHIDGAQIDARGTTEWWIRTDTDT
jgi:hypothetical protein